MNRSRHVYICIYCFLSSSRIFWTHLFTFLFIALSLRQRTHNGNLTNLRYACHITTFANFLFARVTYGYGVVESHESWALIGETRLYLTPQLGRGRAVLHRAEAVVHWPHSSPHCSVPAAGALAWRPFRAIRLLLFSYPIQFDPIQSNPSLWVSPLSSLFPFLSSLLRWLFFTS